MKRCAVIAVLLGMAFGAAPGHAVTAIALQPGMAKLPLEQTPALWADVPDADRIARDLTLTPAQPFRWVFDPGQPVVITAASQQDGARLVLTVWDWNNAPVARAALPSPCNEELRFTVTGRGTYLLTLDRYVGEQCQARLARSFTVCPSNEPRRDTWRQSAFWPGCCSFPGRQHWRNDYGPARPDGLSEQDSAALDAELSARLGLILDRLDLPVEWPAADKPLDFTRADWALRAFTSRGFKLALQIGAPNMAEWCVPPPYQNVTDPKWRYPRTEAATRQFAREVATRYAADSAFVEIYNEPDNLDFWRATVPEFVATHHWIAEEVRRAAPTLPIISGGLCLMDPERTGLIVKGIADAVSGVGYHSHGGVDAPQSALTAMIATHAAAGYEHPVFYNTEMGFANWRLDMERASAATAVQKLFYCWAHGNRAALLYCSRDIGGPRRSGDWGFLDYTMCPRFTYGAVAAFMDVYAGATFDRTLAESNGLYVYVFRQGDRQLVTAFVANDYPRPVTLKTDATAAALLDPMGNSAPASLAEGKLTVTAGYAPTTVVLTGGGQVRLEGG